MRCELFYWSGCCANANNFPSIHSCQRSCEGFYNAVLAKHLVKVVGYLHYKSAQRNKLIAVDPCQQNLEQGYGDVSIRRYYFNKSTKTCEQFNYHGNSGNRNNFQSLQECQQQCPEKPNPCAFGSSIPAVPCYGGNTCTVNQFCHIGQFQETTVCCNRSPNGNQCGQVLVPGLGNAHLQRWYFNITSQYCQPFIYKGLQGNENNFLSPSECQSTCFVNPCALGEPYRSQNDIVHCSSKSSTSCPSGYFCHFGAMLQTTVCCPKLGNACEQPVDRGEGSYQLQRWYWNGASQRCIHFVYGGLKGTQNNFLSEESCEKACYVSKNPCALGAPQQTSNKRPLSCSSSYNICGPTYWCHIGAEPETTVCCPGRGHNFFILRNYCTVGVIVSYIHVFKLHFSKIKLFYITVEGSAICQLPLSVGFGNANLQRWYFNPSTQTCIPFSYGGMFGNQNNFLTYQGCKKVCPGFVNPCVSGDPEVDEHGNIMTCSISFNSCSPAFWCHIGADSKTTVLLDICELPVSIGEGSANLQRWYFNTVTQKCNQFNYGGLRGNQNNFITEHQCEQTCPVFVNPCATGSPQMGVNNRPQMCNSQSECNVDFWCHIGSGPESNVCCPGKVSGYAICSQPMVSGTGSASLKRWYYDVNSRQCLPFIYHGLKGNQNNFLSQQQCQLACPAYVNVCPEGDPLINSITNQPQSCTFEEMNCGPNYWCHLGLVPSEYQCCPGKETKLEVCQLPKSLGVLGAAEPPATRWYYEPATMACKTFQYNGRKGNQNNFLTKADCEATCPVFINPCNRPIALPAQSCSPSQECTSGSYCHYGLTPETTICCPLGNRCELPKVVGTGNGSLQRWFYNPQKGICEIFIYRGLHGNANNYLSKESCEMACQINPCANGREDSPFTYVTTQMHSCPSGYWCNPGVSPLTTVCCPGAVSDPCNLPVITGEGTDQLERYYYDRISQTCKMFTYGGMKGNQNNFLSKEACQLRCHPLDNPCIGQPASTATGQVLFCSSTNKEMCPVNFWCHIGATPQTTVCCPGATNPCSVPLSPGTGNAGLSRWYYNPDDRECLPFQYNGKRGNQNNFESQADCARTCPEQLCLLSIDRGACNGHETRYAFDRQQNQCISFDYTSCGGNLNNFHSLTDCISTCGQIGF
ncbi:unnamed protein product [Thelazia callipaeda]|uniref:Kunitz/Bovine pancreatic trypsin inhibitor domain protein n=1 Tax=Thelazia callipaeda TaxID=103827 RepID=A0A0N5D8F5_THECL|nr:unnamed protein product [Thelazia callipaeda]